MPGRPHPYGAFNFEVVIASAGDFSEIRAGFSEVSFAAHDISMSDYREGADKSNVLRKIPNTSKCDEVTFKRGLSGDTGIFEWFAAVLDGAYSPRSITITVLDEGRDRALEVLLERAQPKKWTGPTLVAKGGGEVAIEELKVVCEDVRYTRLAG